MSFLNNGILTAVIRLFTSVHSRHWFETFFLIILIVVLLPMFLYADSVYSVYVNSFLHTFFYADTFFEANKQILSAVGIISGSIITVAALVFTLTITSLLNMASNLSNRIIISVLKTPEIRLIMGLYVSTFLYTLLFLIVFPANTPFIPLMTLGSIIALTLLCLFSLVYYFQSIISSTQVDKASNLIADDIIKSLSSTLNPVTEQQRGESVKLKAIKAKTKISLKTDRSGYIDFINYQKLYGIACQNNLMIDVTYDENHYLLNGSQLCQLSSSQHISEDVIKKVNSCFEMSSVKFYSNSIKHKISQLTDIAMKTLSPGINDTNSALIVMNSIGAVAVEMLNMKSPQTQCHDELGYKRLKIPAFTFDTFMTYSLHTIILSTNGNIIALMHIAEVLNALSAFAKKKVEKDVLKREMTHIQEAINQTNLNPLDKERFGQILSEFKSNMK